jgi:hypothetical protein
VGFFGRAGLVIMNRKEKDMAPQATLSKRIEFRYSRHDKEIIVDRDGRFPSYAAGDLVERRGKIWKATLVRHGQSLPSSQSISVHVVNLIESR